MQNRKSVATVERLGVIPSALTSALFPKLSAADWAEEKRAVAPEHLRELIEPLLKRKRSVAPRLS